MSCVKGRKNTEYFFLSCSGILVSQPHTCLAWKHSYCIRQVYERIILYTTCTQYMRLKANIRTGAGRRPVCPKPTYRRGRCGGGRRRSFTGAGGHARVLLLISYIILFFYHFRKNKFWPIDFQEKGTRAATFNPQRLLIGKKRPCDKRDNKRECHSALEYKYIKSIFLTKITYC